MRDRCQQLPTTAGSYQQLSATAQHYAAQYYAASCMNCLSGRGTIPILCCPATCRVAEYTIVKIEPGVVILASCAALAPPASSLLVLQRCPQGWQTWVRKLELSWILQALICQEEEENSRVKDLQVDRGSYQESTWCSGVRG